VRLLGARGGASGRRNEGEPAAAAVTLA
jgi:hypothetical protein